MVGKVGVLVVLACCLCAGQAQAQFNFEGLARDATKAAKRAIEETTRPTRKTPAQEDKCLKSTDLRDSALTGVGLGVLAGGVLGKDKKDMLKGGALGGAVGAGVGYVAAEQRKKYCSESDFLDGQIAATQATVSARETSIRAAEQRLVIVRSDISRLEKERGWNDSKRLKAQQQVSSIDASIKANEAELTKYNNEINYLENVISTSQASNPNSAAEVAALEARKKELGDKKQELASTHARLLNVNDGLRAQKGRAYALLNTRAGV